MMMRDPKGFRLPHGSGVLLLDLTPAPSKGSSARSRGSDSQTCFSTPLHMRRNPVLVALQEVPPAGHSVELVPSNDLHGAEPDAKNDSRAKLLQGGREPDKDGAPIWFIEVGAVDGTYLVDVRHQNQWGTEHRTGDAVEVERASPLRDRGWTTDRWLQSPVSWLGVSTALRLPRFPHNLQATCKLS